MESWVPLSDTVCIPVILLLFQHLGKDVFMHPLHVLCPPDSLYHIHSYHLFRRNVVLCPVYVVLVSCVWEKILNMSIVKAKKVYHFN